MPLAPLYLYFMFFFLFFLSLKNMGIFKDLALSTSLIQTQELVKLKNKIRSTDKEGSKI